MTLLRLNSQEFARYHQQLADRFRPALVRGAHSGAARCVAYLVQRTREAPPANPAGVGEGGAVNTGNLLRGWRWKPLDDGAIVHNLQGYSPIVELGRRAGSKMPPLAAIVPWIRRRLGMTEAEAMEIQYIIRKRIAERGLIGRRIMTAHEAHVRQLELLNLEVVRELERELRRRPSR